ncbi:hypothetical protein BG004_005680 [Podila humilis]|nr:hypothetical protein BG004_005680 [Podila humilis]
MATPSSASPCNDVPTSSSSSSASIQPPIKALQIPEILHNVGRFIPYSKRAAYHRAQGWVLDPSHWYACMRVCRLWHDTFEPLILYDLDDSSLNRIPTSIILKYKDKVQGLHLRLFKPMPEPLSINQDDVTTTKTTTTTTTTMTRTTGMTVSTLTTVFNHLRELELTMSEEWTSQLIRQNPRLEKLYWKGGDFHRDNYQHLDYETLIGLHKLRSLRLDCWTIVDAGQLLQVLEQNAETLRVLALEFCKGGISFDKLNGGSGYYPRDNSYSASSSASSSSSNRPSSSSGISRSYTSHSGYYGTNAGTAPSTPTISNFSLASISPKRDQLFARGSLSPSVIELPFLSRLSICKDVDSGPMEDLIRCCPNLDALSWTGPNDRDLPDLIRILRLVSAASSPSSPSSYSKIKSFTYAVIELTKHESLYAELIQCFKGMEELQIKVPTLSIPFFPTYGSSSISYRSNIYPSAPPPPSTSSSPFSLRKNMLSSSPPPPSRSYSFMVPPFMMSSGRGGRRNSVGTGSGADNTTPYIVGFTEALLGGSHRSTLKILDLRIQNQQSVDPTNISKIFNSCTQLRALSIEGSNCRIVDFCRGPWRCDLLAKLILSGLHESTKGSESEDENWKVARKLSWRGEGDNDEEEDTNNNKASTKDATAVDRTTYGGVSELGNTGSGSGDGDGSATIGNVDDDDNENDDNDDNDDDDDDESDGEMEEYRKAAALRAKVSTEFMTRLLSHMKLLDEMRVLTLNGVQYTRIVRFRKEVIV